MAIIYSYQTETNVLGTDLLVGTSTEVVNGKEQNVTRNYTIQSIGDFFSSSTIINPAANDFFIPVFNQEGQKITDSIIRQDVLAGTTITINGALNVTGSTQITGITTLLNNSTIGTNAANTLVLNSTTTLGGPVRDYLGNLGGINQVLISNINGNLQWVAYQAGLTYLGAWDASTNTPTIVSGVGTIGSFYIVSVAGTTPIDGIASWQIGDWIIFAEAGATDVWQKIDAQSSTFQATDSTFIDFTPTTLQTGTVTLTGDLKNGGTTPTNSKFYRGDGTWAEMAQYGVQEVNGSAVGASSGAPLLFTNVTGPIVGISPRSYAGGSNIGYVPDGSANNADLWLNGQGGWTSPAGGYSKWILEGDNATTVDILNDGRVDFTGGTGITTEVTAGTPNLLTINNDGVLDVALGTLSASTGNPLTLNLAAGVETITPHTFAGGANIGFVPSAAAVSGDEFLKRDGTWSLVSDDGVSTITTATPNQLALTLPGSGDGPVNINTVMAGGVINNNTGLVTSDEVYDYIATNAPGTVVDVNVDVAAIAALSVTPTQITGQGTFVFTTTGSLDKVIRGDGSLGTFINSITSGNINTLTAVTTTNATVVTPITAAITGAGTSALTTGADVVTYVTSLGKVDNITTGTPTRLTITEPTTNIINLNIPTAAPTAGATTLSTGGEIVTYVTTGINNRIQNVTNPTSAQDVATKNYVDAATVGGLIYQGGFDGATGQVTGTSDYLDSRGTQIAVTKGWTYTVTNPGTFYTETVGVGDVLIAEVDIASGNGSLSNWTTVQNNIGIASTSAIGIGNVVPGSSNTITSSYTSGTATLDVVDSTSSQKGAVIVAGTAGDVTVAYSGGTATISSLGKAGTVTNVSSNTLNQLTVSSGASTPTLSIITGTVTGAGTALATGGEIATYVTGLGYGSGTVTSVTSNSTLAAALTLITDLSTPAVPAITLAVAATHTPSGKFLKDNGTWDTVPAGYSGWDLQTGSGAGAKVTVAQGDIVELVSGAGTITTSNSGLSASIDMTSGVVTAGSFIAANITVDTYGRVTAAAPGPSGTMSSFDVSGNGGATQTISDGDTLAINGTASEIITTMTANTVTAALADVTGMGGAGTQSVPLATVSVDAKGRVTAVSAGSTGTYTAAVISVNTTGLAGYLYVFTAALDLQLPAGGSPGTSIKISNLSNTNTCRLIPYAGGSGEKIMSSASTMTLDTNYASFELIYSGTAHGWVIIGAN